MMKKVQAFIYYLSYGNPQVFGVMLISAIFIVIVRILGPFELGWDQAIQLEAAHRLIHGLGLTSTYFATPFANINQSPEPQYLTWFPPAFSLIVACLFSLKLSLALSLKIIYSLTTISGWLGWASIASNFLSKPMQLGWGYFSAQFAIAALLPVFYTPLWEGTDIFLWAGLPFIIILFVTSAIKKSWSMPLIATSGVIFGLLYSFRYASLFVAVAAFFILFQVNFPHIRFFLKSYIIFISYSLLIIFPVYLYSKLVSISAGLPQYITDYGFSNIADTLRRIISNWCTISTLSGMPLIQAVVIYIQPYTAINYIYGILCFIFICGLPIVISGANKLEASQFKRHISLSISLLPISVVIFLMICMFFNPYNFLENPRYYIPAVLSIIFISYDLATRRTTHKFIKMACSTFIVILVMYNIACVPLSVALQKPDTQLQRILSYIPKPSLQYPSNKVVSRNEDSLSKLKELQKINPEAVFFIQYQPNYIYDGSSGFRLIPGGKPGGDFWRTTHGDIWEKAYVDKAVKIFWVVDKACPGICNAEEPYNPMPQLSALPNTKTIFTYPDEGTKILVSDLPSGYKF